MHDDGDELYAPSSMSDSDSADPASDPDPEGDTTMHQTRTTADDEPISARTRSRHQRRRL